GKNPQPGCSEVLDIGPLGLPGGNEVIVLPPGNHVKMNMKGGLSSSMFVRLNHGHSIGVECTINHARHARCGGHERSGTCRSDIENCSRMHTRNDKRVPLRCWLAVKERNRVRVLIDDLCGLRTADDAAERAGRFVNHVDKYCSRFPQHDVEGIVIQSDSEREPEISKRKFPKDSSN